MASSKNMKWVTPGLISLGARNAASGDCVNGSVATPPCGFGDAPNSPGGNCSPTGGTALGGGGGCSLGSFAATCDQGDSAIITP